MSSPKLQLLLLLSLFTLSSCSSERLHVQSDYLSHEDLASSYVDSPDPRKEENWAGQRILVQWAVPKDYLEKEDLRLEVTLRFRNREQTVQTVPLKERKGHYIYRLLGEDFFEKEGILTYKAEIVAGKDEVLERWKHQIWVNFIDVEMQREREASS